MKKINLQASPYSLFFLRHGRLLLPYKDHGDMPLEILADLASAKLDPAVDPDFVRSQLPRLGDGIPFAGIARIYASPSRRCRETAMHISGYIASRYDRFVRAIVAPELREVRFDLLKIHSVGQGRSDIGLLNDEVLKAMSDQNDHCEAAAAAYQRVSSFLGEANLPGSLFVSHDFIMRVIEIYIRRQGALDANVGYQDLLATQRNLYLRGFSTDTGFKKLLPI